MHATQRVLGTLAIVASGNGAEHEAADDTARAHGNTTAATLRLPRLLVGRVLPAVSAELLVLDPSRLFLLVLRGRVIAPLAVGTFQRDNVSHGVASSLSCLSNACAELATGIEPVTSSLPRKCSTN